MPVVSSLALFVFVALVAVLAGAFILTVWHARSNKETTSTTARWILLALIIELIWLGVPAVLAQVGLLRKFDLTPPPFVVMVALLTLATLGVALSPLGTRLVNGISIGWLVGFQAFRVPVEWILHRLYLEGVVPVQMTYAGRNFDIVSGLLAVLILGWAKIGRPPRRAIWAFNLVGLGLLINIVVIAVLSTPTALRRYFNEPANTFVAYVPFVWLPSFLVQAAWFGHLLVFRWLRQFREQR